MKIITIAATAVLALTTWAEETSPSPEAETAMPAAGADLSGWRVCPVCAKLNEPDAAYCIYCGADLSGERRASAPKPKFDVVPAVGTLYSFTNVTPGVVFAGEGRRVREEVSVLGVIDFSYHTEFAGALVASDTHFYIKHGPLRPFISARVNLWVWGGILTALSPGGGVRYNYGRRGSFFSCGAGPSVSIFPTWSEYGPDTYTTAVDLTAKFHIHHLFTENVGVSFAAESGLWSAVILYGGPAFAF